MSFSADIDDDHDPATNPTAMTPVPVVRFSVAGDPGGILHTRVVLAAEVLPTDARQNPATTEVTFELWNPQTGAHLVRTATADAWGAAQAPFDIPQDQMAGRFSYRATAPGYGLTPTRTFRVGTTTYAYSMQVGDLEVRARGTPGRLMVDLKSPALIGSGPFDAQVLLVALHPSPNSTKPTRELLPVVIAKRLDDHHAHAEIFVDRGDYLVSGVVVNGQEQHQSVGALAHVAAAPAPPIAGQVEVLPSQDGATSLVQYRTASGDAALIRRGLNELTTLPTAETTPPVFQETTRLGAFKWETDTYTTTVQTLTTDGHKVAVLSGFHYDPLTRRYDITVTSHHTQPIDDKLTVEALGPNGVVVFTVTTPVHFSPTRRLPTSSRCRRTAARSWASM